MNPLFVDLYKRVATFHREAINDIVDLESITKSTSDLRELADQAQAVREVLVLTNHLNNEVKKYEMLLARLFTAIWGLDPSSPAEVETDWCACSPDPKVRAKMPRYKDEPEEYSKLLRAMGLPESLIETGSFRLSFDDISEIATRCNREGRPLPEGLGKTWTEFYLKIRTRRKLATVLTGARLSEGLEEENDNVNRLGEDVF